MARDIEEAVRQGLLTASKVGSGGDRDLEDLLKPQIDWRQVLREFITDTCAGKDYSTYRKPNRGTCRQVSTCLAADRTSR